MAKTSHKHRALKMLEALGWTVGDVEKWIPRANRRIDLFGFADLICVKGEHTLAVQVCSIRVLGSDMASHQAKMLAEPRLARCLEAGWLVELWGIRQRPRRDGETVSVRSFALSDDGDACIVFEGSDVTLVGD